MLTLKQLEGRDIKMWLQSGSGLKNVQNLLRFYGGSDGGTLISSKLYGKRGSTLRHIFYNCCYARKILLGMVESLDQALWKRCKTHHSRTGWRYQNWRHHRGHAQILKEHPLLGNTLGTSCCSFLAICCERNRRLRQHALSPLELIL